MNLLIPDAMAQGAGAPQGSFFSLVLPMLVFVVIFYFLLIRPQQKKAREHQAMLSKLAVGDEVVAAGGILGKIVEVGEQFITLEVSDGVRIKVQKAQINLLVPKGTLKSS